MSPPAAAQPPTPAAAALANRVAAAIGVAVLEERRRRRWALRDVAERARLSLATVSSVEAGRRASLDVYARLAVALGLSLDVHLGSSRSSKARSRQLGGVDLGGVDLGGVDLVHAAMGELQAGRLAGHDYRVAVDQPYQHYQFAGRADLLAWTLDPPRLLHIENRTRFPDLQQAAGSYNAKRQFLAPVVARQIGASGFISITHVMVGLWSSEVVHSIRSRPATFRALCPDDDERYAAWMDGAPPATGTSSSLVLLDLFAGRRSSQTIDLERVIGGARPRIRGYREAALRLRQEGRA